MQLDVTITPRLLDRRTEQCRRLHQSLGRRWRRRSIRDSESGTGTVGGNSRGITSGSTSATWSKPSLPGSETPSGDRSSPRWWTTHAPTVGWIATTGCEHTVNHSDSAFATVETFVEPVRSSFV